MSISIRRHCFVIVVVVSSVSTCFHIWMPAHILNYAHQKMTRWIMSLATLSWACSLLLEKSSFYYFWIRTRFLIEKQSFWNILAWVLWKSAWLISRLKLNNSTEPFTYSIRIHSKQIIHNWLKSKIRYIFNNVRIRHVYGAYKTTTTFEIA